MLHLPRKTSLRCSKCCTRCICHAKAAGVHAIVLSCRRTSADLSGGAPSAAPAKASGVVLTCRQTSADLWRCCKCCTCHTKAAGVHSIHFSPNFRRELLPTCLEVLRAAPAWQNEPEVLQVLHLPRKTSLRCSKCCTCHAKANRVPSTHLSPDFRGPLWRCCCNAKRG